MNGRRTEDCIEIVFFEQGFQPSREEKSRIVGRLSPVDGVVDWLTGLPRQLDGSALAPLVATPIPRCAQPPDASQAFVAAPPIRLADGRSVYRDRGDHGTHFIESQLHLLFGSWLIPSPPYRATELSKRALVDPTISSFMLAGQDNQATHTIAAA